VPADIDPLLGIYLAQMGPICANGLLHAAADLVGRSVRDLGDGVRERNVVIMGGGVVALLTGLFARQRGAANVVLVTSTAARRRVAEKLGLTCIDESVIEAWRFCKERWHYGAQDRGADLVFQCKVTTASLQAALRCLRPQGTVIDLAFYQGEATELRLGEEFHHNCLTIRSAQINHVPLGLERTWHRRRLAAETMTLLREYGPLLREYVITDIVPFEEAPAFMSKLAAAYQPQIIQAVLAMPNPMPSNVTSHVTADRRSALMPTYTGANHDN
jgi:threonine dehydrogenase-like Zn-dependent dehydrogenase